MSARRFWLLSLGGLLLLTLVVALTANHYIVDRRIDSVSDRLLLTNNLRREALQRYLATAEAEMRFWSTNPDLLAKQRYFRDAWREAVAAGGEPRQQLRALYVDANPFPPGQYREYADAGDGSVYSRYHAELHPLAKMFVSERGYYDFFLIDPAGNIAYSVEKEPDFATNLRDGEWRNSGLARVYAEAMAAASEGGIVFSDFERYAPSNDAPALFMARAMRDAGGEVLGVLAFQLPTQRIVDIIQLAATRTRTGEAYVVGPDLLMRSDSRFSDESTILRTRVDTVTVDKALRGEYGVEFTRDYRGVEVLSAYSGTLVGSHPWAVMVEIDRAEVLEMAASERRWLAGLMLFFYGLGAWSLWYMRGAEAGSDSAALVDLEFDSGMDLTDA